MKHYVVQFSMDSLWNVSIDGKPIGAAYSLDVAKDLCERDAPALSFTWTCVNAGRLEARA